MELIAFNKNSELNFELMTLSQRADFASYMESNFPGGTEYMKEVYKNEFFGRITPYELLDYYFDRFLKLNR